MIYTCSTMTDDGEYRWDCSINLIDQHGSFYEADIQGNGYSFHVIVGPQVNGRFLCIPNWHVGCELAALSDVFWNSEQIRHHLNPINTRTIAIGLHS